jgi:hypothetical protein
VARNNFEKLMIKASATVAAGRLLNYQLYLFVKWLRDKHQLDNLESLLVAIEILKSLPNVLMKHEIDTYLLKSRTAHTEPKPQPDEHQ